MCRFLQVNISFPVLCINSGSNTTAGSGAKSMLSFIRNHQPRGLGILISNEWAFLLPTSMLAFGVFGVHSFGHANSWIVTSGCIYISLMTHDMEPTCTYACSHLHAFLNEMSAEVLTHFFNQVACFLVLSLKGSLCVLDNSPLSLCLCKYFHSSLLDLSSHSFDSVFHRTEGFNFDEVSLSIILSMTHAFGVVSKRSSILRVI